MFAVGSVRKFAIKFYHHMVILVPHFLEFNFTRNYVIVKLAEGASINIGLLIGTPLLSLSLLLSNSLSVVDIKEM